MPSDPSNARRVRLACVGCGQWGRNLIRNFVELEHADVVGLCRADPRKLAAMREDYPRARLHHAIEDVCADAEVEAVVIATPAPTHHSLARSALLAGKHVFVEKPMALRATEAAELTALASQHGCVLMVGHLLEYAPAVRALKGALDDGRIGTVRHVHLERLKLGRARAEESVLWSFAPHDLSVLGFLLGREAAPTIASAVGHCYLQPAIEDIVHVDLEFPGQISAHVHVSWLHAETRRWGLIVGTDGMLVWDDLAAPGDKVTYHRKAIDPVSLHTVDEGGESLPYEDAEPLRLECQHFLDCVLGTAEPLSDGRDGEYVVGLLERISRVLRRP